MIEDIKLKLLSNPEYLKLLLERFGFANVINHGSYISCGRDESSSKKSIVLKLNNNKYLYMTDYPRNFNAEIFQFIIKEKGVDFKNVINVVKEILGLESIYYNTKKIGIFGGVYDKIRSQSDIEKIKLISECEIRKYSQRGNIRFLRDGISLQTQRKYDICYDKFSSNIVFPIRDQFGSCMGIKARVDMDINPDSGMQKYWFPIPCRQSLTLFGYCQNYSDLVGETVYILESEKSVMQGDTMGYHNLVALGSGSLSKQQAKMLASLQPKKIVFLHDQGYEIESIMRNIDVFKKYSTFIDVEIGYWDWRKSNHPQKVSPTDRGKKVFEDILKNEIVYI